MSPDHNRLHHFISINSSPSRALLLCLRQSFPIQTITHTPYTTPLIFFTQSPLYNTSFRQPPLFNPQPPLVHPHNPHGFTPTTPTGSPPQPQLTNPHSTTHPSLFTTTCPPIINQMLLLKQNKNTLFTNFFVFSFFRFFVFSFFRFFVFFTIPHKYIVNCSLLINHRFFIVIVVSVSEL